MNRFRNFAVIVILLVSCNTQRNRFDINLKDIPAPKIEIKQYGKALFELDTTNLKSGLGRLQPEFPVFLSGDLENKDNINRIRQFVQDTLLIRVYNDSRDKFSDIGWLQEDLTSAFRYITYYYPTFQVPKVYTYISGFDYEHAVQFYQGNLLIALDTYLGPDYPAYKQLGIPQYVLNRFSPDYIVRDCIEKLSYQISQPAPPDNNLLGFMIQAGKQLWFIKAAIPDLKDEILFNYTKQQMDWARHNEGLVWAFIIENNFLYSPKSEEMQKFIDEAPFTSFFGKESPPRLGWFTGYQIVNSYMQKNSDISIGQLMKQSNSQEILKESFYKPGL